METWLIALVSFIPMLLLLVVIHELGHFWTAKAFGIKVLEFGVGFPPRAFGIYTGRSELLVDGATVCFNGALAGIKPGQVIRVLSGETPDGRLVARYIELPGASPAEDGSGRMAGLGRLAGIFGKGSEGERDGGNAAVGSPRLRRLDDVPGSELLLRHEGRVRETGAGRIVLSDMIYSVNWLPLGGFVRMPGENDPRAPHSLARRKPWQRAVVLAAGSAMNALFPVVAFTIMFMVPTTQATGGEVLITEVGAGSPAEQGGLQAGDRVVLFAGEPVTDPQAMPGRVRASAGAERVWTVEREGRQLAVPVTAGADSGTVGIRYEIINRSEEKVSYPPWTAARMGVIQTWDTLVLLRDEVRGWFGGPGGSGRGPELSGPIGIAQVTGEVTRQNGLQGWTLIAILLSINLAILNILPIPMLDGGRLLFVGIEWLRGGKRIPPEKEGLTHLIGFVALMALIIAVSANDIIRLIRGISLLE